MGRDSTSVIQGKDSMRQGYQFLDQVPAGFRAEILKRMVAGRYVIDHERVVTQGRPNQEALAILRGERQCNHPRLLLAGPVACSGAVGWRVLSGAVLGCTAPPRRERNGCWAPSAPG